MPMIAKALVRLALRFNLCCVLVQLAAARGAHEPGAAVLPCARAGRDAGQRRPGWPYSFVAALGPGATSWTAPLDAVRLGPDDDDTAVTAAQLRAR